MPAPSPADLNILIGFGVFAALQLWVLTHAFRQRRRMLQDIRKPDPRIFAWITVITGATMHTFTLGAPIARPYSWWITPLQGGWDTYHAAMVIILPLLNTCLTYLFVGAAAGLIASSVGWLATAPSPEWGHTARGTILRRRFLVWHHARQTARSLSAPWTGAAATVTSQTAVDPEQATTVFTLDPAPDGIDKLAASLRDDPAIASVDINERTNAAAAAWLRVQWSLSALDQPAPGLRRWTDLLPSRMRRQTAG
jgi:hypothetical protein